MTRRLPLFLLLLTAPGLATGWPGWDARKGPHGGGFANDIAQNCEDLSAEPISHGMLYEIPGSGLPEQVIDMQDIWLAGGCVGCHNVAALGGLRLDQPANGGYELILSLSFRDPTLLLVEPGEPENSLLYAMLNCTPPATYPIMPPPVDVNSQRIARPLRAKVYDWIAQGARGFDEDNNPYSDILFRDQVESDRLQKNLAPPPAP